MCDRCRCVSRGARSGAVPLFFKEALAAADGALAQLACCAGDVAIARSAAAAVGGAVSERWETGEMVYLGELEIAVRFFVRGIPDRVFFCMNPPGFRFEGLRRRLAPCWMRQGSGSPPAGISQGWRNPKRHRRRSRGSFAEGSRRLHSSPRRSRWQASGPAEISRGERHRARLPLISLARPRRRRTCTRSDPKSSRCRARCALRNVLLVSRPWILTLVH